jgi:tetratricopeptide (TPR) repeat protein
MDRDRAPLDAPDAEELRAAAALGEALEGRAASPDLPQQALETAALLRFSGPEGELSSERRARIRASLLADLPAPAPRRRRWAALSPRALSLWIPAVLGAGLAVVFASRALLEPETASPATASRAESEEPSAVAAAPKSLAKEEDPAARRAAEAPAEARGQAQAMELEPAQLAQLAAATRSYRAKRIKPLMDAPLERVHAQIAAATSGAELERLAPGATEDRPAASRRSIGSAEPDSRDSDLVRQDLFCRLAEAALRVGQPEQALEWAKRGLDLDGPPNPLLAQLTAIDGQARASLGDRMGAAKSYLRALEINETLLDEHLDGP